MWMESAPFFFSFVAYCTQKGFQIVYQYELGFDDLFSFFRPNSDSKLIHWKPQIQNWHRDEKKKKYVCNFLSICFYIFAVDFI